MADILRSFLPVDMLDIPMDANNVPFPITARSGAGSTCSDVTLNTAIAAIGATRATLILVPRDGAGAASSWTLNGNVTTNANTFLLIEAPVVVNSGFTLTINGPWLSTIGSNWYSGAGTVTINYREPTVDGLSSFIVSGGAPQVPSPGSLTFAAFACRGNITFNAQWHHVNQTAASVGPLNAGNGTYWLALHRDTTTVLAGWTRQAGTQYLWQLNAVSPGNPIGGLLLAQVTVAGGVITVVTDKRKRTPVATVSFVDFGADPTGVADSSTAIQEAFNSGYKQLVIEDGTYKINTTLTLPAYPIEIVGQSRLGSLLLGSTVLGANIVLNCSNVLSRFSVLQSFSIHHDGTGTCLRIANQGTNCDDLQLVSQNAGGIALDIVDSVAATYKHVTAAGKTRGAILRPSGANVAVNLNTFINLSCSAGTASGDTGCKIEGGAATRSNVFIALDSEQCFTGIDSDGLENIFIQPWTEGIVAGGNHFLDSATAASTIYQRHSGGAGVVTVGALSSDMAAQESIFPQIRAAGISLDKLVPSTTGIRFPATNIDSANPNTLDDYEEGTWTAAFIAGTSGTVTISPSFNTGFYTKISSRVFVNGIFTVSAVAAPVGTLSLSGLPFPVSNLARYTGAAAVSADGLAATATTMIEGFASQNTTLILLRKFAAGVQGNLAADVIANSEFIIGCSYINEG